MPATISRGTNFSPAEIACGCTGKLLLGVAALDRLQALRDRLGKPLIVRSAYRSPEHNRAVGGATRSKRLDAGHLSAFSFPVAAWLSRRIGLVNTTMFTHIPSRIVLMLAALALLLVRAAPSQMDVPTRSSYVMAVVIPEERAAAASFTSVPRSLAGR